MIFRWFVGSLPNTMMTMSVDGMQGEDNGSSQLFQTNVAPDAVEEIKVLMNNYQAEYGRNGAAGAGRYGQHRARPRNQ